MLVNSPFIAQSGYDQERGTLVVVDSTGSLAVALVAGSDRDGNVIVYLSGPEVGTGAAVPPRVLVPAYGCEVRLPTEITAWTTINPGAKGPVFALVNDKTYLVVSLNGQYMTIDVDTGAFVSPLYGASYATKWSIWSREDRPRLICEN